MNDFRNQECKNCEKDAKLCALLNDDVVYYCVNCSIGIENLKFTTFGDFFELTIKQCNSYHNELIKNMYFICKTMNLKLNEFCRQFKRQNNQDTEELAQLSTKRDRLNKNELRSISKMYFKKKDINDKKNHHNKCVDNNINLILQKCVGEVGDFIRLQANNNSNYNQNLQIIQGEFNKKMQFFQTSITELKNIMYNQQSILIPNLVELERQTLEILNQPQLSEDEKKLRTDQLNTTFIQNFKNHSLIQINSLQSMTENLKQINQCLKEPQNQNNVFLNFQIISIKEENQNKDWYLDNVIETQEIEFLNPSQ